MKFHPEKCRIKDERMKPFIDAEELWEHLNNARPTKKQVREIIKKSVNKNRLTLEETATLVQADDPELIHEIKEGAHELKEKVYGNRIVLFAPLYIGNKCVNNCKYCGFRVTNTEAIRKTLSDKEIVREVEALEDNGQKRLILVYGEHPEYNADYIAHTVRTVYGVKKGKGEIRRVNINAAPLEIEDFKKVGEAESVPTRFFRKPIILKFIKTITLAGKTGLQLPAGFFGPCAGSRTGRCGYRRSVWAL